MAHLDFFPSSRLLSWFNRPEGRAQIKIGRAHAQNQKIAIVGVARDAAGGLRKLRPQIEILRSAFANSCVVVYENDSIDKTTRILNEWQKKSENVYIRCEHTAQSRRVPCYSEERIGRMAECRNTSLKMLTDAINTSGFIPDWVLMVDWDLSSLPPEGIFAALADAPDWDVLTANGLAYRGKGYRRILRGFYYYDTYALRACEDANATQTQAEIFANWERFAGLSPGMKPVPVHTAFGGAALYRWSRLKGHSYSVIPNPDPIVRSLCDHPSLQKSMHRASPLKIAIHPAFLAFYDTPWKVTLGRTLNRWKSNLLK